MKRIGWICLAVAMGACATGAADMTTLGDPPTAPSPKSVLEWRAAAPVTAAAIGGYSVAITNREAVRSFFNTVYQAGQGVASGWTGNEGTCNAGATLAAYQNEVCRRINFYRAMAGVPANIVLSPSFSTNCQQAALMMSANNQLSHFVPTNWSCYTAGGANAASNSNIALGDAGPDAISGYIQDDGTNNYAVGHRRWILYPQTQTMGTGDIPANGANSAANATWIFDGNYGGPRPATRDGIVCWPPPGYVPYQLVWPYWSCALSNADFSGATVTLSTNNVTIPVTKDPYATGYGENALVFHPGNLDPNSRASWPAPGTDTTYKVAISNVVNGAVTGTISYSVIVFNASTPGPDTVLPVISGPDFPVVNQSNAYPFIAVPGATGHQWRQARRDMFTAIEGAESGTLYFVTNVTAGYSIVTTSPVATGTAAFHLAHPSPVDQTMTYTRALLPGTNSQLRFHSRLGYATTTQVASVQFSLDEGSTWNDVYRQAGSGSAGETSYVLRAVSLTNYTGRSILMRLQYAFTGDSYFTNTSSGVGWYIDTLSFTNTEELTALQVSNVTSGTAFAFRPTLTTNYALQVRGQVFTDFYIEWGPARRVTATLPPPSMNATAVRMLPTGQFQLDFDVSDYTSNLTFQLLNTTNLQTGWSSNAGAVLTNLVPGARFRFTTTNIVRVTNSFYRVKTP